MQSYWQSAVAAKPSSTYTGYILGGLCWFCIPFTLATSLGLASRALDLPLSADEAGSGVFPAHCGSCKLFTAAHRFVSCGHDDPLPHVESNQSCS